MEIPLFGIERYLEIQLTSHFQVFDLIKKSFHMKSILYRNILKCDNCKMKRPGTMETEMKVHSSLWKAKVKCRKTIVKMKK